MNTAAEKINDFVLQAIEGTDCFLISFAVKPTNNYKVFLDSDTGLTLEKSIFVNRAVKKKIEEEGLYPDGDFSLEVSSPGIDEPLKLLRQYKKNIGRDVEIETNDELLKTIEGKLVEVNEDTVTIETEAKKKVESKKIEIPFIVIKKTIVLVKFK